MAALTTTSAVPTPTSTDTPPGPTQSGIAENCNRWVLQKEGEHKYPYTYGIQAKI